MGTNYYAIPKVDEATKIKMHEAIDRNDFDAVKRMTPETVHIGKSSFGWAFIFNHHNWEHFGKELLFIKGFLNECQIVNEYGDQITHDGFWELVENKKDLKTGTYCEIHFGHAFSTSTDFS